MIFYTNFIRNLTIPKISPDEQKALIDSFPEPKDDIDRVYFHYKCRFHKAPRWKMFVLHLLGFAGIPVCLALYILNRLRGVQPDKHDAVLINAMLPGMTYDDKLPPELREEFSDMHVLDLNDFPGIKTGIFSGRAFKYWLRLFLRHPLSGYVTFNCLTQLMNIERLIRIHAPKAIINYRVESTFASSMITRYCEEAGIEYICFMHGDYLVSKERAFARFSRMYLWDEHYIDIFTWARMPREQLRVYPPRTYYLDLPELPNGPAYDLTYYCSGGDAELPTVVDTLTRLSAAGKKCKVRPHPRFSDREKICSLLEPAGVYVEDALKLPLAQSIANTRYVAGKCSTVLSQAFYAGKSVVIDDISDVEFFESMADYRYIMLNKPHKLLSHILQECN